MSKTEGSLGAPTRHPIAWRDPAYYDQDQLDAELARVFDICHGCRRCVNLCNAFPTLFDLVDASTTMEVDGVSLADYPKVVDQCYLCDLCFMTKCPYVPPHEWNVDFPKLMLRAKAARFRREGAPLRDRLLANTDLVGRLASIPVVAQAVNAANRTPALRVALEKVLHVDRRRELPPYAPGGFRPQSQPRSEWPVRDGERTAGKVALFPSCYVSFNEPGIGLDLLALLEHNEIPVQVLPHEACCGMPRLELGDLAAADALKQRNIGRLVELARAGWAILTPVPSCTLMFRKEWPLLYPDDPDVAAVAAAMVEPCEYLVLRRRDGLLKTDFARPLGKVAYHLPCHSRVQNIGQKTRELLEIIPETEVVTIERCSGHDGSWGVKQEYYEESMRIGRPVVRKVIQATPDYLRA